MGRSRPERLRLQRRRRMHRDRRRPTGMPSGHRCCIRRAGRHVSQLWLRGYHVVYERPQKGDVVHVRRLRGTATRARVPREALAFGVDEDRRPMARWRPLMCCIVAGVIARPWRATITGRDLPASPAGRASRYVRVRPPTTIWRATVIQPRSAAADDSARRGEDQSREECDGEQWPGTPPSVEPRVDRPTSS